jgi:tRNA (mo5U34)-methyltransferase
MTARRWFHTFDFGDGLVTPGVDPSHYKAPWMGVPTDLGGKRVLDVGTYEGFFAFEAERRGAREVLAIDHEVWSWPGDESHGNFRFVHELLGSAVRELNLSVEELSPETVGGLFDVVLFLGVLYHARDPIGYLTRLRSVTRGMAIIETVVDLLEVDVPAMAYYPGASLNNDSTNFFGPNLLAVEGMVLEAGFARAEFLHLWRWHEIEVVAGRPFDPEQEPKSGRAVFYAWV